MMRKTNRALALVIGLTLVAACSKPEPLTAQKAQEIIKSRSFKREPVYAEVPQKVWWTAKSPKDDYDELAVRTLRNLERAGLVTITEEVTADSATYVAKVTKKGFPILGTAPSYRGPVYRAKICEKVYDGLRNFVRHPQEPTVGHAELVWHYDNANWLYPLFETKINKPLKTPFASHVSFWYDDRSWKFAVNVRKAAASCVGGRAFCPPAGHPARRPFVADTRRRLTFPVILSVSESRRASESTAPFRPPVILSVSEGSRWRRPEPQAAFRPPVILSVSEGSRRRRRSHRRRFALPSS